MCIRDRYALTPLWAVLGSYLLALLACLAGLGCSLALLFAEAFGLRALGWPRRCV